MLLLKSVLVWLVFIMAESLNGTLRIFWLVPLLGDGWAHQVSFITGAMLVIIAATLFIRWLNPVGTAQLIQIGGLWLFLTLLFEIGLGRWVLGYSWAQIGADYNVRQGGLMPFGLLLLILAPFLATKLRGLAPKDDQVAP